MLAMADPVMLFTGIRVAQEDLGRRVDRPGLNAKLEDPVVIDLQALHFESKEGLAKW